MCCECQGWRDDVIQAAWRRPRRCPSGRAADQTSCRHLSPRTSPHQVTCADQRTTRFDRDTSILNAAVYRRLEIGSKSDQRQGQAALSGQSCCEGRTGGDETRGSRGSDYPRLPRCSSSGLALRITRAPAQRMRGTLQGLLAKPRVGRLTGFVDTTGCRVNYEGYSFYIRRGCADRRDSHQPAIGVQL